MSILYAAILGIIQGLAEFIPISSSGHLELARRLMGLTENNQVMTLLTVLLHAGTLIAVIVVFWPDWLEMLKKIDYAYGNPKILVDYRMRKSSVTGNKKKVIVPQWNVLRKV